MTDAVVAGHLCIDIIPRIPADAAADPGQFLAPGRLVEVGEAVLSMGGAVSNTGLSLARLGLDVRLVARVGDDDIAAMTRAILKRHGADLGRDLRVAHGEPSSYTIVVNPPGRDRSFLHCPGTNNTFGPEDVPVALLDGTRLFHFGYPPLMRRMYADGGAELAALLATAGARGATTSLDMALPDPARESGRVDWREVLARTLPHVGLFEPSIEELCYMLDRDRYRSLQAAGGGDVVRAVTPADVTDLAEQALGLGAQIAAVKLGDRGIYLRTRDHLADLGRGAPSDPERWRGRELWAPCFRVAVAGTAGAGDATIAGLLAGVLRGQAPEDALTSAVAVGACCVEAPDATGGVRGWRQTQERIRRGWPRLDARVTDPGWQWDEEAGLWRGPHDPGR